MLTSTSEYALRAMVHLSQLPPGEMVLGRDLSVRSGIPANYLSKILLQLKNAGFLDTIRGQCGGYRLRMSSKDIHVIDVVELFEGIRAKPKCLLGEDHECADNTPCSAHAEFRSVRLAYIQFLEKTTIEMISSKALDNKDLSPR